jgi:hypothetical protein
MDDYEKFGSNHSVIDFIDFVYLDLLGEMNWVI